MTSKTLHVQLTGFEPFDAPASVLRERSYGATRVTWTTPFEVEVDGDESLAARFFHDVFLIRNLAEPGSFGGTIAILPGGEEVTLSPRVFEYGRGAVLPLEDVVKWYDSLRIGAEDVATEGVVKALFLLLHLARRDEDETVAVVRLAQALEALEAALPEEVREMRDAIVHGSAPVVHPLADEDEVTLRVLDAADAAAAAVVQELQRRIRA